ncbi:MAG: phosphatase PAP2 family protein [Clostridia bacterium]|nr:phosphatase PAP2 family protein [Clostridia bacterium]
MSFLYFLEDLRCPVLDFLFSAITLFGEETIFMAVGMIFFWCVDKFHGYYLLCVGFFGTLINQFLKITCRIPRPWVKDPDFTIVESAREGASGYSFPSGHTQVSTGLYGGAARIAKKKTRRILLIVLASLIALSRMYLGVHTPADVFVSVGIAATLIFIGYPIFQKGRTNPKLMYGVLALFLTVSICFLVYVTTFPFPEEIYAADTVHNLESALKNAYTLLGCSLGFFVVYTVDLKWINFQTEAVWWAQILKVFGGLALVILVKEGLKVPLDALFQGHLAARSLRYFIMVVTAGSLWPLTFPYFAKLGKK